MEHCISIHALLAESDPPVDTSSVNASISIHALLAESDNSSYGALDGASISIHALLAESDYQILDDTTGSTYHFYPRSPCGERLSERVPLAELTAISIHALLAESDEVHTMKKAELKISIHALLAESDVMDALKLTNPVLFLSTLSLRRATLVQMIMSGYARISIHALLAESDA